MEQTSTLKKSPLRTALALLFLGVAAVTTNVAAQGEGEGEGEPNIIPTLGINAIRTNYSVNFDGPGGNPISLYGTGFIIGKDYSIGPTYGLGGYGSNLVETPPGYPNILWPYLAVNNLPNYYTLINGGRFTGTDYALGVVTGNNPNNVSISEGNFLSAITNNTGSIITSLTISFDYEKYRTGSRQYDWTFFHGNNSVPSIPALAGNQSFPADANSTTVLYPATTTTKTVVLTGLSILPGENYYFHWNLKGVGGNDNAQIMGIDNFSITADNTPMIVPHVRTNTFVKKTTVQFGGVGLVGPITGDVDGDGDIDIIAQQYGGSYSVMVFKNDGTGNYGAGSAIAGLNDASYQLGDLDGDGDLDIISSAIWGTQTSGKIFQNNGLGNFTQLPGSYSSAFYGGYPLAKIIDINQDGKNDIVYIGIRIGTDSHTEIWLNTGTTGNPNFALSQTVIGETPTGNSVAVEDIDGDGDLDMVTGGNSWPAQIFVNNGGTFAIPTNLITNDNGYAGSVFLIDWDNDGDKDLVRYDSYNSSGLYLNRNDGHGNFSPNGVLLFNNTQTGFSLSEVSDFKLVDVNNDGYLDAVLFRQGGDLGNIRVLLNTGCSFVLQPTVMGGGYGSGLFVGDLDNDGFQDMGSTVYYAPSFIYMNDLLQATAVPLSNITATTGGSGCGTGSSVTLSATASNGGTIKWWNASSGGSLLATGVSYSATVSSSTAFYVDATNSNGCVSARVAVNVTVSAAPVVAINNSNPTICAGGSTTLSTSNDLVGYWKFNEGAGSTVADASGNNLNGTFTGSLGWSGSSPFAGSGSALSINGGGYAVVNDHPAFAAMQNKMTMEAWVYQTDNSNNTIVDKGNYNFLFMTNPNGQPGLGFYNNSGGWSYSTTSVPVNQWVHLAITWDGATKTLKFYKNGVLTDTFIRPSGLAFDNGPLNIGRQSPTSCQCNIMNGSIDELRLWSVVKSAAEIQANMNASLVVSTPATYVWSPATGLNTTIGNSVIATPTSTTTYTVTATNASGCVATANSTVIINPKPTASISTASPLTVCLGGAVLLDASTNASSATYQWFRNGAPIPTATNASFNAIVSGSYTVVVANASGCVSNTSNALVVTIQDIIKPFFTSGGTITSATNAQGQVLATSAAGAVVNYSAPVGADNCTVVSNVLTSGLASGSIFPIGTTTVIYTVTDGAGLTETSSFNIVVSGLAPAIIAPANITVNNDEGLCGAAVSFAATGSVGVPNATITYTENGQPVVSGATFATGVHTITASATNSIGSSSTSFTITVKDVTPPTISSLSPVTINVTAGLCTGTTVLVKPTVTDNCVGVIGNGLAFDGSSDYVDCGNGTSIRNLGPGGMTMETWVNPTRVSGVNSMIRKTGDYDLIIINGKLYAEVWHLGNTNANFKTAMGTTNIPANQWTHVAAVWNGSTFTLYVNGVLDPSSTSNRSAGVSENLRLGVSATYGQPYAGVLDELRIWNVAKTGAEILANKNLALNAQTGLVAVYHFDQGVAGNNNPGITTLTDASGNNNNGTLNTYALNGTISNWVVGTVASESTVLTNNAPANSIFPVGTTTVTWTATDASGNSATTQQVITVVDNQVPVISAPANISVNATSAAGAMVTYVAPVGTDNCSATTVMTAGLASGSTFPIGTTTVTYTVTDASGNMASASFTVTVVGIAPVIVVPEAIRQNNDAGQCGAVVSFAATETTAIPASTIVYTENGQTIVSGHYFAVGTHTITATATNAVGSSSGTFTITVNDVEKPMITVAAQTQSADAGVCKALVTVASPVTADNCAVASVVNNITETNNASGIYPVGTTTITWTVTDIHGNITTATQNITVKDEEKPIALTQNITVQLNASGAASITASQINNGSTDNCGIASITVDKTSFYCSNVGANTVTLTVTDIHGNVSTATAVVTVQDNIAPVALAKNITIGLSEVGGTVSITAADVNNGSSDACGIASMTVMPSSFSCANVGANTVTLTVTDVNGNVSTTTAIVTVVDDKGPVPTAVLPVISGQCSVKLVIASSNGAYNSNKKDHDDDDDEHENNGATVITAPTAMDNCSGLIKGTTTDPFTYYNQGTYIIRWKFVDARGNVTIQEQTVIVKDTQAPRPKYASLPTITGQCSVSIVNTNSSDDDGDHEGREGDDHDGDDDEDHFDEHQRGAPWAKDNCSGWIRGTTTDPLTYSVQGTYIIRWTFNDGHGNISTQNQMVIVKDITKPKIKAPNDKTVTCGSNTAPAVMGMATATDNCSVPVISYTDVNSGTQIVRTWRATDAAGNFSIAVQTIKLSTAFSGSVVSVPTSNVYTGGEVNNLYLGYGAQGTALTVSGLPSSGAPYTYSWTGVATNRLSATNTGAPVFSPIAGGVYTFTVTMTNKNGCSNTASISICVTDIRVPGSNGALVYVCHKGSGKTGGTKTLEVPVAQVASHIQTGNCGGKNDRLGSCDQNPCNSGNNSSAVDPKQLEEPIEVKPELKAAPVVVEELKVVVMPNPTTTYFTIRLESKDKAPVNLRVMDGSGRVIDAKQKMEPNSSFQMGHGYSSGTYYAEFIQGNKRKVIQLIKGRG